MNYQFPFSKSNHNKNLFLDKISRHIPSHPVYSQEMSKKIELEEDKLRSMNSIDKTYLKHLNAASQDVIGVGICMHRITFEDFII